METIKATTQRGQRFINAYKAASYTSVLDAYGRPSTRKVCAEIECKKWMQEEGGHDYRVTAAGSQFFTCGWMTAEGLRIETAYNSYLIK